MLKKIIPLIFILMIAFSSFSQANEPNLMNLSFGENETKDEIKININIEGTEDGVLGIQGKLNFDKNKLELVNKEIKLDNFMITSFNEETGIFLIEIDDDSFFDKEKYIHDSTDVLELTFKLKKKFSKSDISIDEIKLVNSKYETIDCENVSVRVKNLNYILIICIIAIVLILLFIISRLINKQKK